MHVAYNEIVWEQILKMRNVWEYILKMGKVYEFFSDKCSSS